MVADEGHPALLGIGCTAGAEAAGQVLPDSTRRDSNPQLEQEFAGDSGLAPTRVGRGHFPDEFPQIERELGPATGRGFPAPEPAKPFAMPSDQSVWVDNDEGAAPVREPAGEDHHELCRAGSTVRFDLAFLKQRELFSKQQILGGQRAPRSTQRSCQPSEVRDEVTDQNNEVGEGRDQMACERQRDSGSHARRRTQVVEKASLPTYGPLHK